uniref:Uncharacterized protein n=1 Tax=Arundo donax TaxID=35708 RepID=A0A0A9C6U6_ARUDO
MGNLKIVTTGILFRCAICLFIAMFTLLSFITPWASYNLYFVSLYGLSSLRQFQSTICFVLTNRRFTFATFKRAN